MSLKSASEGTPIDSKRRRRRRRRRTMICMGHEISTPWNVYIRTRRGGEVILIRVERESTASIEG
jgi:hypothetical protein